MTGESGGVVIDGSFSETSGIAPTVATPTAARAADQPTSPSWPLVRPSQPFKHRISWRIFPIPPTPTGSDQHVIEVGAIQQGNISTRVHPYLSWPWVWRMTSLPKTTADPACLARVPKAWPFSGQSMPLRRTRSGWVLYRTLMVSPSRTEMRGASEVSETEIGG